MGDWEIGLENKNPNNGKYSPEYTMVIFASDAITGAVPT